MHTVDTEVLRDEVLRGILFEHGADLLRQARLDLAVGSLQWTSSLGERSAVDVWLGLSPAALAYFSISPARHEQLEERFAASLIKQAPHHALGGVHLWWASLDEPLPHSPYRDAKLRAARRDEVADIHAAMVAWRRMRAHWMGACDDSAALPTPRIMRLPDGRIELRARPGPDADRVRESLLALGPHAPPHEISWIVS